MSEQSHVEEPQANPYNAKKSWDKTEEVARGLNTPNSMLAYPDPSKEASTDASEATQDVEEKPEEVVDTKYSKVDYKKRHDDLKRHYDKKLIEWKAQQEQLQARLASTAPKSIPKTPEELATFKEEYSDVYDVVESVAQIQAQEQLAGIQKEIDALKQREIESSMREARLILQTLQPEYDEITASEEFHEWAKQQPQPIQDWIYENPDNAELASRAIDLYKKDVGFSDKKEKPKKKPAKKQDAAEAVLIKDSVDPTAGEKKIWTSSEIDSLSIQQYEKHAQEIDDAFKERRVIQG